MAGTGVAASTIQSPGSFKNPKLLAVLDVDIDKSGKFKYVLIRVHDPDKDREFKHIVRGYHKFEFHGPKSISSNHNQSNNVMDTLNQLKFQPYNYHFGGHVQDIRFWNSTWESDDNAAADIYDDAAPNIEARGLDCEIMGGGRLHHDHSKKTIHIFGYSQAYGRADHRITAALLQRKFPEYENITWSNDGY